MTEFVVEAGFRTKWQPGWLPGMPPERKGDILVFDYPSAGRTLVLDVTCVGPYTSTRGLNHTPNGLLVCAARIAEGKKKDSYAALDKTNHEFLPLAFVRRTCFAGRPRGRTSFSDVWRASS
jgi:hypothetical protein